MRDASAVNGVRQRFDSHALDRSEYRPGMPIQGDSSGLVDNLRCIRSSYNHRSNADGMLAIPADSLGTRLDDRSAIICVGLRLGASLVEPHRCSCGEPVGRRGHHGLSCALSPGRRSRHAALNDTLSRALRSAGVPCMPEPSGLTQEGG